MSLNMKTLTQALAKTAAVIEKTVSTTVQEVTGPRPLQDYDLLDQVGSGGPGLAWRLYSAHPRTSAPSTQYPLVCVWVLDKRALSEARTRAGLSKAAEDAFFEIARADAARLVRLRHPGVVHVVQALDESKTAMAMVTEPLFASVANAIGDTNNIAKVPKELKGMEIGLLEVKHGLLQVAECLDFLHNNARLVHRSISPETVYITSSGAWKLGGFGFAVSIDQISNDSNSLQPFHYPEYDVEDSVLPLQPSLNYTAPELVRSRSSSRGFSSDIFSFACLAYHLVARKPLLDCHNNVKMYTNSLTYLSSEAFSAILPDLIPDLRRMLSMDESSRPSASDFTGSSFFRDDTRLRALRFLDHMLERDNMQKTEFLKALSDMWKDFDSRILRYKVLPPLCAELRNVVMQPMILPMVLTIAESQDKVDFELSTLPALVPVLNSASGETLLLLVKHSELIINKASHEHLLSNVLPLLVRAYDDTDPRIQEEVLRRTVALAKKLDIHLVKQAILPRVHSLALRTTVAAVRVNALRCLGDMVPSLDKHAVEDILQTLQRCTAVDRSAPTLMCTLAVSNSILKQHGIEFAAEHVVPSLFPLLTAQQLNVQQFAKYMLFIKDILRKIEEKRGIAITDTGNSEFRVMSPVPNGGQSEPVQKSTSLIKKSYSWDEDWGPVKKESVSSSTTASIPLQLPSQILQTNPISAAPLQSSISSAIPLQSSVSSAISAQSSVSTSDQQSISSTASEIEWPPRNPSAGSGFGIGSTEKVDQNTGGSSGGALEDIDPFANWPPKPSSSGSSVGFGITPTSSHGNALMGAMNPGLRKDPIGFSNQHHSMAADASKLNGIGFNSQISSSLPVHGNSLSSIGASYSTSGGASTNFRKPSTNVTPGKGDIGSIFNASNNGQVPLRLAPPPPKAIGRGRGRGQGNTRPSSSGGKTTNEKPPHLDLL